VYSKPRSLVIAKSHSFPSLHLLYKDCYCSWSSQIPKRFKKKIHWVFIPNLQSQSRLEPTLGITFKFQVTTEIIPSASKSHLKSPNVECAKGEHPRKVKSSHMNNDYEWDRAPEQRNQKADITIHCKGNQWLNMFHISNSMLVNIWTWTWKLHFPILVYFHVEARGEFCVFPRWLSTPQVNYWNRWQPSIWKIGGWRDWSSDRSL